MVFAFVFLIVAGQFGVTTGQNCGFPGSWQMDYWWIFSHKGHESISRYFRKYETSSEINFHQDTTTEDFGSITKMSEVTCRDDYVINQRQRYYVRDPRYKHETKPECLSLNTDPENKMLVQYRIRNVDNRTVSMSCALESYSRLPDVFIRYPFVFDAACPFAYDQYMITVRRAGDAQPMCGSGRDTISIDRQTNKLTISACFSKNSYEEPFLGATLRCVGDLEPEDISSTSEKGKVYVFGYTSAPDRPDDSLTHFYVSRYMEAANGTVFMSLQGRTDGYLHPDWASDYRTVDDLLDRYSAFSYAFVMSPSCKYAPCKNGGSCQDSTCACPSGYTSFFCETDIDDCLPDTCNGNGKCTDHPNRFSCDCYYGYEGLTCETDGRPKCTFPVSWRKDWWVANNFSADFLLVSTYKEDEEDMYIERLDAVTSSVVFLESHVCLEMDLQAPYQYYIRYPQSDSSLYECVKVFLSEDVPQLMVHSVIKAVIWSCDFEEKESFCNLVQDYSGTLTWHTASGETDTPGTGPSSGYGGNGTYMYLFAEVQHAYGTSARIETPPLNYNGAVCLEFAYNMYGRDVKRLAVYTKLGSRTEKWQREGDQGTEWFLASVEITLTSVNEVIGFEAFQGNGIKAHIAVDAIRVKSGNCEARANLPSCFERNWTNGYPSQILVQYANPFNFSFARCPFATGSYHLEVHTDGSEFCANKPASVLNVRAGVMIVNSCLSGSSYNDPFSHTTLTCVGEVPPHAIGALDDNGSVLVLAYNVKAPSFYTARFMDSVNGSVQMSLQRNGRTLRPNPNMSLALENFDIAFKMESISCEDALCENGATCETDVDNVFMCLCPVDFTGVLCEILVSTISTVASVTARPDSSTSSPLSATTLDSNNTAGPQAQSGGSSDATPTIIGAVVVVLVVIIILAVVGYVYYKSRKKAPAEDSDTEVFAEVFTEM